MTCAGAEERSALEALARRCKTTQALALRPDRAGVRRWPLSHGVAADLEVTRDPVRRWRSRFLEDRLHELGDAPPPGAPRTITDEQVELAIAETLAGQDTHRSTNAIAAGTGMSQTPIFEDLAGIIHLNR